MLDIPDKILPEISNTYTIFCPYLRHYKYNLFDPDFKESNLTLGKNYPEPEPINPSDDREYGILFSRWLKYLEKIGSEPGLFSYYQLVFHDETERSDRQRYLYHPDPELVEAEIKKFIECGIKVFYDCSPPYPGFWPDGRFYAYIGQLLWENGNSAQKIVKEYYKAIAGERAEILRNILKLISNKLDEDADVPPEIINTARSIFDLLPFPADERYSLWLEYVVMGRKTRVAMKQRQIGKVIENERKIIEFFERNRMALEECINVDWMIKHSRSIINFYAEK